MITLTLIATIFPLSAVALAWWALRAPSAEQLWGANDPERQRLDVLLEPYAERGGRAA